MLQPRLCRVVVRQHTPLQPSSASFLRRWSLAQPLPSKSRPGQASLTRSFAYSLRGSRCCSPSAIPSPHHETTAPNTKETMDPRTERVINAMQTMYPEALADKAWDNVGVLLANTQEASMGDNRVLLTNDLTPDVANEAIRRRVHLVISYHPIIFRGLKSITLADPQQASLIRLAQRNIAVYSPHTALDAAPGGINDWLADGVVAAAKELGGEVARMDVLKPVSREQARCLAPEPGAEYQLPTTGVHLGEELKVLVGYGRLVELAQPVNVFALAKGIYAQLGLSDDVRHALIVRPRPGHDSRTDVKSVALCAGSGADVLRNAPSADLLLTGEMSHHDALAASARGQWVVCMLHSNSERLFLRDRLKAELDHFFEDLESDTGAPEIVVSQADEDPFVFVPLFGPGSN